MSIQTRIKKYSNLFANVRNTREYLINKQKRFQRPLIFYTKPNELKVTVPKELYLAFKEIFMLDFYNINSLAKQLPKNPVVIDIGANAGYFEAILMSKLNRAQIFAFEPLKANYELFTQLIKDNPLLKANVNLYPQAVVGSAVSEVTFYVEDLDRLSVIGSIYDNFDRANKYKIVVPSITLENIIASNQLSRIDLLKMDCEGGEFDIIYKTSPDTLQKIDRILLEVHDLDEKDKNVSALQTFFLQQGFGVSTYPINAKSHFMAVYKGK